MLRAHTRPAKRYVEAVRIKQRVDDPSITV